MIAGTLVLVIACVCAAPQERKRYDSIVATVNGTAITESEADEFALLLGPAAGTTEAIVHDLVLTRLESDAAAKAGVNVPDDILTQEMKRREIALGGPAGYAENLKAFGRSAEQDREFVRKRLAAHAWVDACLGFVPNSSLMRPDLARKMRVTPDEIRTFFELNKALLQTEKVRTVAYVVLHKDDYDDDAAARAAATALRATAAQEGGDLQSAANAAAIKRCGTWTFRGTDTLGLRTEVVTASWNLPLRETAEPIDQGKTLLLLQPIHEDGGAAVALADVQDAIERELQRQKRADVRAELDRSMLARATISPATLFPKLR